MINTFALIWQPSLTQSLMDNFVSSTRLIFLALVIIGTVLVAQFVPRKRKNLFRAAILPVSIYLIAQLISVVAETRSNSVVYNYAQLLATIMMGISLINLSSLTIYDVLLGNINLPAPRLLRDTSVIVAYLISGFLLLTSRGVNVSALITPSAILTIVVGLALQDTLGNIIAGFALQLENIIQPGDWIKLEPYIGRVKEIRWRQTSIETRNWDTILIPNSQMVKGQVMVYGRRKGQPLQTRRWIYFNIDFRYSPNEVINCVNEALQANPIPNVSSDPRIHAILMDFKESYCSYAVRYWLTELAADDPTDSNVRIRMYYALKRADIPLSIPAHSLFVTEKTSKREIRKQEFEIERRITALHNVEIFQIMTDEELRELAKQLHYTPFSKGELLTRQGTNDNWLYIITAGEASVRVTSKETTPTGEPIEKEVARLTTGDFLGEMSLTTGATRSATVEAINDVQCYRLDKEAFQKIVTARPQIAEDISHVLARRRVELEAALEGLDEVAHTKRVKDSQIHILSSIRQFFGL